MNNCKKPLELVECKFCKDAKTLLNSVDLSKRIKDFTKTEQQGDMWSDPNGTAFIAGDLFIVSGHMVADKTNGFAVSIIFCPMCGKELKHGI